MVQRLKTNLDIRMTKPKVPVICHNNNVKFAFTSLFTTSYFHFLRTTFFVASGLTALLIKGFHLPKHTRAQFSVAIPPFLWVESASRLSTF
jgi:glycerophosphoryl diester phosphodiesterase